MTGLFGIYGSKRYWDCYAAAGNVNRRCVSRRPGHCPGYRQGLRRLFKRVKPSEQEHMLCWLHNQRSDARGLCVGETVAQLRFWASPQCSKTNTEGDVNLFRDQLTCDIGLRDQLGSDIGLRDQRTSDIRDFLSLSLFSFYNWFGFFEAG